MDEHCSYPDEDFPWTLYFNGKPMPRWANCWSWLPLLGRAKGFMRDWDEPVGYPHLWRLHCRIDHVGTVESEEPDIFRLCCLTLAFLMLRDEAAILEHLAARKFDYSGTPTEIFAGVRDGLFAMQQLALSDGIAFWTSGYDADCALLCDSIRRHRLPQSDPAWLEAPHVSSNRSETQSRLQFLRGDITALLGTRPIPKDIRRIIHALPKNA